ncbi:cellulase family glycosylhydrolase [Mycobacterium yunnanensis]|uniref:Cellulase family glycosylhydrolase n=1 Tax=Mycobacterium yunnanensis TaxID=368477 RepID=A0A9X2Z1J6_9MYCO|nr:glycoside hydrolase family 5 protein [Mycobacterium yunnanensis]MCV7421968.1 cellulase family glycosylhydrolase [Mycobacterium yunnanensis]
MTGLVASAPACGFNPAAEAETSMVPLSEQVVGISTVATMQPGTDIGREVDAIASVGVNAIRVSAKWNLIEPDRGGPLRWGPLDAAVRAAREHGLRLTMTLEGPAPRWAQDPSADPAANGNPPLDANDFGRFAEAVARRYSDATTVWEIWNEPNIPHYLDPPTVATYIPLLQQAFSGIRRAGSVAPVLTGGTSSNLAGTRDIDFIRQLYDGGAQTYFDGIALHPYTFPLPLSFSEGQGSIVDEVRQLMRSRSDDGKKVWITEFGQPTGSTTDSVSEDDQARILSDAIRESREVPWIGGFFIFNTVDLVVEPSDEDVSFGLFRRDYTPKPAVDEVRAVLDE